MQPPMIRANLLEPILDALEGYDTAALLCAYALPQTPIDPYQLIPLGKYVALFEHAAQLLEDPCLGLKLGHAFRPDLLGPLGFLFQASVNLRQALATANVLAQRLAERNPRGAHRRRHYRRLHLPDR